VINQTPAPPKLPQSRLTDAARLVIIGVIAAMMTSIVAIVLLTYLKIPVPEAISTIPAIALAALVGLLGRTHPDAPGSDNQNQNSQ
jgi:phosphate/sulfate permease